MDTKQIAAISVAEKIFSVHREEKIKKFVEQTASKFNEVLDELKDIATVFL